MTILECKPTVEHFSYNEVYDDHHDENAQQHHLDILSPIGALDLPGLSLEVHRLSTGGTERNVSSLFQQLSSDRGIHKVQTGDTTF